MGSLLKQPLVTRERRGVALVWATLTMLVVVGLLGLAIDTAYVHITLQQLQNAADAGALFGAKEIKFNEGLARANAAFVAHANEANRSPVVVHPDADVQIGRFSRITGAFTFPTLAPDIPNAIKVTAHKTEAWERLGLIFGPINTPNGQGLPDFEAPTASVSKSAIARVGGSGCIVVLHLTERNSFEVSGNVTLDSTDCDIYVNSNNDQAAWAHGDVVILAEMIHVGGGYRQDGSVIYDGEVDEGAPPMDDPLAFLPDISTAEYLAAPNRGPVRVNTGETRNLVPGYYPDGITANGGRISCAPGIYVCDGEGLQILAGSAFMARGCMFYVVDSTPSGNPKSIVKMVGSSTIEITPIDPVNDPVAPADDWYLDYARFDFVSIYQARDNSHEADIGGGSATDIRGALYFRNCRVVVTGTSGLLRFDQLVADRLSVQGDSVVNIGSTGRYLGIALKVFLVQ